MADITAGMVKELRERTGSGMMECKRRSSKWPAILRRRLS
jgi:translation elongation factor EF-Ts